MFNKKNSLQSFETGVVKVWDEEQGLFCWDTWYKGVKFDRSLNIERAFDLLKKLISLDSEAK